MPWRLDHGDCLEVLRAATSDSIDSMVTDPPAGIGFMGREWDSDRGGRCSWIDWLRAVMAEAFRVLKPGAHGLIWAIPRTSHWTATALEDAGFEIRDVITHHFGSGFPKSQDVGKFMDKLAGAERTLRVNEQWSARYPNGPGGNLTGDGRSGTYRQLKAIADGPLLTSDPVSDEAKTWGGWGTALKPATEHWILVRKPLSETSIARNVLRHATGALNIDACRVEREADDVPGWHKTGAKGSTGYQGEETFKIRDMTPEEIQERCGDKGRWPTNLLFSHDETCGFEDGQCHPDCPVAELDRQSGVSGSGSGRQKISSGRKSGGGTWVADQGMHRAGAENTGIRDFGDSGGASRYFPTFHYFPKPSRREREAGLENEPTRTLNRVNPGGLEHEPRFAPIQVKNNHPTVKGKKLMAWLITLVTPPKGWVLDPFAGSGSTGVAAIEKGFSFWGIEKDPDYYQIAEKRIEFACLEAAGQMSLFDEEDFE